MAWRLIYIAALPDDGLVGLEVCRGVFKINCSLIQVWPFFGLICNNEFTQVYFIFMLQENRRFKIISSLI